MTHSKKSLFSIILTILIFPQYVAFAEDFKPLTDFKEISPTVKVMSYDSTYNNEIFPLQIGSATIITKEGIILTNNHVIEDYFQKELKAFEICFSVSQNANPVCEYTASIIARSPKLDLALLKIDPTDIRGNPVNALPFLDYTKSQDPKVGDKIKVIGYPGIGGATITSTEGVVSGFTDKKDAEGVTYIKSDTMTSSGNSGGAMLDSQGSFIGIPTSVHMSDSTYGNLGYSIDIRGVRSWINENISTEINIDNLNKELSVKKKLFNDSNNSNVLNYPFYPKFNIKTDTTWSFDEIEKNAVIMSSYSGDKVFEIMISIDRLPFTLSLTKDAFLDKIFSKIEKEKDRLVNYKREIKFFAGAPSTLISFNSSSQKKYIYLIPYGYALMQVQYAVDRKTQAEDLKKIQGILDTFKFQETAAQANELTSYKHTNPSFEAKTFGKFLIQETENNIEKNNILNFIQKDSIDSEISISYYELSDEEKETSNNDLLKNEINGSKYLSGFTLINKDTNIKIDGLEGWSLSFSYQGQEYEEDHKRTKIFLKNGNFYFDIQYDDLEKSYDKNLGDFKKILKSFKFDAEQVAKNKYKIGNFNYIFNDIQGHRYIIAISQLKDRGIIDGYPDGSFKPEDEISRAEALKIIIDSKLYNKDETLDKRSEVKNYSKDEFLSLDFKDIKKDDWYSSYLRYARDKKIVNGYDNGLFDPNNKITTSESLAILFKTYNVKIWKNPENRTIISWYKPYMDKAVELDLLPIDLLDPAHQLTRAEFSYIVESLMKYMETF